MTYDGRWTYKFEEAARRGALGHAGDSRDRPGLLWLGDGQELEHRHDDRHRAPRSGRRAPAVEGWLQRRDRRRSVQERGPGFRGREEEGAARRFPAADAREHLLLARLRGRRSRASSRRTWSGGSPAAAARRNRHLYGALGSSRHWRCPTSAAIASTTAPATTPSGIASLLEIARLAPRRRTRNARVVFLALTAEEKGLLGSEDHAQQPVYPLEKTVAVSTTWTAAARGDRQTTWRLPATETSACSATWRWRRA